MAEYCLFHHVQGETEGLLAFADETARRGSRGSRPDVYEGKTFAEFTDGGHLRLQRVFSTLRVRNSLAGGRSCPDPRDGRRRRMIPGGRRNSAGARGRSRGRRALPRSRRHLFADSSLHFLAFLKAGGWRTLLREKCRFRGIVRTLTQPNGRGASSAAAFADVIGRPHRV